MVKLQRYHGNPILRPNLTHAWEHEGAFNGCVCVASNTFHLVYRALSSVQKQDGVEMRVSSIGYTSSSDGFTFGDSRQIIAPVEDWEIYGCEDPRITYLDGKYYIFYTALSVYPFAAYGIKLAVAITKDFKTFEKHPVTTFNSKAMALFPEKINGKFAALLTIDTDMPPAKIALALFDKEEDMWNPFYWEEWYENVNEHLVHLLRDMRDQVELGAPPIKTKDGWLVIYSYIRNYLSDNKVFGIEAVLLDLDNPQKVLGRTAESLMVPEMEYELKGDVPNVTFPSGALVRDETLYVYYGAADTSCGVASLRLEDLLQEMRPTHPPAPLPHPDVHVQKLERFADNPILVPTLELDWQAKAVYNPAAIYLDGKVHILYRAQSNDNTSTVGYATSRDGIHIDENFDYPIYYPRADFEMKTKANGNSGCEDPRISKIGDRLYMLYTAYDGTHPPRVAMTSISITDFLHRDWNWEMPKIVSLAEVDDKDACLIEGRTPDTFLAFHRLGDSIWVQVANDLHFSEHNCLTGNILAHPRKDKWDNVKLGISAPPIPTEKGWLLLYHGVSEPGFKYKVGAMLLDYDDPFYVIARTDYPIFEPEMPYEIVGQVPNVVFPCGAVVIDGELLVYYGGADSVVGVATMKLEGLLDNLLGQA
jgi:predicted GH43/DUF377 family glycosyl hydrolase